MRFQPALCTSQSRAVYRALHHSTVYSCNANHCNFCLLYTFSVRREISPVSIGNSKRVSTDRQAGGTCRYAGPNPIRYAREQETLRERANSLPWIASKDAEFLLQLSPVRRIVEAIPRARAPTPASSTVFLFTWQRSVSNHCLQLFRIIQRTLTRTCSRHRDASSQSP